MYLSIFKQLPFAQKVKIALLFVLLIGLVALLLFFGLAFLAVLSVIAGFAYIYQRFIAPIFRKRDRSEAPKERVIDVEYEIIDEDR